MTKKSYFISAKFNEFWCAFKPLITDFIIIGALGFMIYWTRWRK